MKSVEPFQNSSAQDVGRHSDDIAGLLSVAPVNEDLSVFCTDTDGDDDRLLLWEGRDQVRQLVDIQIADCVGVVVPLPPIVVGPSLSHQAVVIPLEQSGPKVAIQSHFDGLPLSSLAVGKKGCLFRRLFGYLAVSFPELAPAGTKSTGPHGVEKFNPQVGLHR